MEEDSHQHQHGTHATGHHHHHHYKASGAYQGAQAAAELSSVPTVLSGGEPPTNGPLFYVQKDDFTSGQGTGRKKLWQCVYPGCTEPPKTHYNCFSHVWDSHVRRSLPPEDPLSALPYKRITDRTAVKELCRKYIVELSDESKRRGGRSPPNTHSQQQSPQEIQSQPSQQPQQQLFMLHQNQPIMPQQQVFIQQQGPQIPPQISSQIPSQISLQIPSQMPQQFISQQQYFSPQGNQLQSPQDTQQGQVIQGAPFIPQYQQSGPQPLQLSSDSKRDGKSYTLDYDGVTNITISPEGLARLSVCGEVFAEHGFLQRSDIRFKEDIRPIGGALERVLRITGKTFRYKGEGGGSGGKNPTRMGFIAQELETVVPDAVHRDEHGLSVDIVCLVPLLLEALKEVYMQTERVQNERASALNEALKDAMTKTQALNEKLDLYRMSSSTGSDYSDSSDTNDTNDTSEEAETQKHTHNSQQQGKKKGKSRKNTRKINKKEKGQVEMSPVDRNGNEELFAGENGSSKRYGHSEEDSTPKRQNTKRHFHYKFSFGPPIIVSIFCVLFLFCGLGVMKFLNNFIFAWAYLFFVSAMLALSLLFQIDEIKTEIKNYDIKVFWHDENTLNVYFLAVVGIFGVICTLILGTPSILCIGVYVFSVVFTGALSVVFHRKYRIRVQSILVMSFGVLILFTFCFVFIYMAQRKSNIIEFDFGYHYC